MHKEIPMSNRMKDSQRRSVFLVCTLLAALAGAPAVRVEFLETTELL